MLFRENRNDRAPELRTRRQSSPTIHPMSGFGEVDQNGDWIPGTDPTNWNTGTVNYVTTDPTAGYVNPGGAPYVAPGGGGVVVPPQGAGNTGGAGGVDWTKIFTAGEQLATGIVNAVVQGSHPSAGQSCPAGYQFVAKAGTCMTPAAYAAWLQTAAGSGSSMTTTAMLIGGLAIGAVLLMKRKSVSGPALSGYSRRRRRRSRR